MTSVNSPASFEFPLSDNEACPPLGQGFDLIAGDSLSYAGTDTNPPTLPPVTLTAGDSHVAMTHDTASYSEAVQAQLDIAGSGWGGSVGLSLSESSFSKSSSSCITLNLDAFQASRQQMIDPKTALSTKAKALLKSDPGKFAENYGSYFVAGYIYGKRCSLAYRMQFSSEEEKSVFSAKLTASYSSVDFSANMSAAISTTQKNTQSSFATDTVCHFAGFEAKTPSTIDDIEKLKESYDSAKAGDATPIKLVIMPWHYLDDVDDTAGVVQDYNFQLLVTMVNKLGYIQRSCQDFVDQGLYAGNQQLQAVNDVRSKASDQLGAITHFLAEKAKTNASVTDDDLKNFPDVEPLIDKMNFALTHFTLAFKVKISSQDDDCNSSILDIDNKPFVLNKATGVFDGSKGCYLDWSLDGNNQWQGTAGPPRTFIPSVGRSRTAN